MARSVLVPISLAVVTGAQRNALTPADGQLIWNSDRHQVERYSLGSWDPLDDDAMQLIGGLAASLAQVKSALRFLGVEPDLFEVTDILQADQSPGYLLMDPSTRT